MGALLSCMNEDQKSPRSPRSPFARLLPRTFSGSRGRVAASGDSTCEGLHAGCGAPPMSRVVCWGGRVLPARADMDRFAVCSREAAGDARATALVVGVFDGHGVAGSANWGRDTAERCCGIVRDAAFAPPSAHAPAALAALFEAFQRAHERRYDDLVARDVLEKCAAFEKEHGFPAPRVLPAEGGSTATVARIRGDELCVAWVGDSRCVLATRTARGGVAASPLTVDHNAASSAAERDRVEAAGGHVAGVYVGASGAEGLLQVTRSLGDRAHHAGGVLLATPEVHRAPLPDDAAFLIVASDGLWHAHDDDAAVAFVAARLGPDPPTPDAVLAAAAALAADAKAIAADSDDMAKDDVTVVVVALRPASDAA